jgi:hypothetical protein
MAFFNLTCGSSRASWSAFRFLDLMDDAWKYEYSELTFPFSNSNQNARQRWNDIYRTGVLHEMSLQLSSFYVKQQPHALS